MCLAIPGQIMETILQPQDIVMDFGPPNGDTEVWHALREARSRGAMSIALSGAEGDYAVGSPSSHPFLHQEVIEILYHVLWKTRLQAHSRHLDCTVARQHHRGGQRCGSGSHFPATAHRPCPSRGRRRCDCHQWWFQQYRNGPRRSAQAPNAHGRPARLRRCRGSTAGPVRLPNRCPLRLHPPHSRSASLDLSHPARNRRGNRP